MPKNKLGGKKSPPSFENRIRNPRSKSEEEAGNTQNNKRSSKEGKETEKLREREIPERKRETEVVVVVVVVLVAMDGGRCSVVFGVGAYMMMMMSTGRGAAAGRF